MTTSSACPDDLDAYARRVRSAADALRGSRDRLGAVAADFTAGTRWGGLELGPLLGQLTAHLAADGQDADRVVAVARAFRAAGGQGVVVVPDTAVEACVRAAGVQGERADLTVDGPEVWGAPPTSGYADDPVNTASGNFVEVEDDLTFGGLLAGLTFTRTYSSRSDLSGAFGPRWASWADARLTAGPDGVTWVGPDGGRLLVPRQGAGYDRAPGLAARVERAGDGLALVWPDGARWEFDGTGRPVRTSRGPGTAVVLRHVDGRLVELRHDGSGRAVRLQWSGGRVVALHSSDGRTVTFTHDADGHLVRAVRDGVERRYGIGDGGLVEEVRDADGVLEVGNTYDADGRVVEQVSPHGRRSRYRYLPGRVTVVDDGTGGTADTWLSDEHGRLLAVVDSAGRRTATTYDAAGRPVSLTERGGATTLLGWDDAGRLLWRALPTGASFTYRYDHAGRVVAVGSSQGGQTTFRYEGDERTPCRVVDPEGGVTCLTVRGGLVHDVTDPDGVRVAFGYDAAGELVQVHDAEGGVARLERDPAGRVLAVTDPAGRRTSLSYDRAGRLVERGEPGGGAWRWTYTPAGRVASVIDPEGGRSVLTYGPHGEVEREVDPLGAVTVLVHDALGNPATITGPDGAVTTLRHDTLSRLVAAVDPTGATWSWEHDADGHLVAAVDPTGVRRTARRDAVGAVLALEDGLTSAAFTADPLGRTLACTRPDGARVTAEYDRCGRRTSLTTADGAVTRFEHTPGGRLRRVVLPGGRAHSYEHDRCGRLRAVVDPAGRRWTLRYGPGGELLERHGPEGPVERWTHDEAGRVAQRWALGEGTTRLRHDRLGRLVEVEDVQAGRRTFRYDAVGHLVEAVDALGGRTRHAYDAAGRLVRTVDPLGAATSYAYDAVGRLVRVTDPLGRETAWTHDAAGRVLCREDGSGARLQWTYDRSGRVSTCGPVGAAPVTVGRDGLGRVVDVVEPGSFRHELTWDRAGRLVARTRDGVRIGWCYDEQSRCTALVHPDGTQTGYRYDDAGELTGLTHPLLGLVELSRDGTGRVVAADGPGLRQRWRYERGALVEHEVTAAGRTRRTGSERDAQGRLTAVWVGAARQALGHDAAGQLTACGAARYGYDAAGRLVSETGDGGQTRHEYDAAGQLVHTTRPDGTATAYEYDGAGRRVRETGARPREYTWDAAGRLASVRTVDRVRRVSVDALGELAEVDGVPLAWDTADALSPLVGVGGAAVVGPGSAWGGAAASTGGLPGEVPDAWGAGAELLERSPGTGLGPSGELEVDGLVWLRARPYDPVSRCFLAPDPLPAVPGTAWSGNPYHYAGNDPLSRVDPSGLRPITDAELQAYRDRMGRNGFDRLGDAADWVSAHRDLVLAGALVVGGVVVMCTGVGGPVGAAMIGGGLLAAGVSTGVQDVTTGHVDWGQVGVDALIGALSGGAGAAASTWAAGSARLAATSPYLRGAVTGASSDVAGGAVDRGLHGDLLDAQGLATDLLVGGSAGAAGGRLGQQFGTFFDPHRVRFSQTSVNDAAELVEDMGRRGFVGAPLDAVLMPDGGATTIDNTRVLAAKLAGVRVRLRMHPFGEPVPRSQVKRLTTKKGGPPATWGHAAENRIGKQGAAYRRLHPLGSDVVGWDGG